MKKNILSTISLTFLFLNICSSQMSVKNIANPYFEIVNMDSTGKTTPVKLFVNKKVNHDAQYELLYSFDFDKSGKAEEIFYSFGSQAYAMFLMNRNGSAEATNLYNAQFDIPEANEGFWFYISDIFGDATPEILIFSKIGENCFVKIINYSTNKKSFVEHEYPLNAQALSKQLLIKNQKILYMPYGSQGLFDEVPLIIE